MKGCDVDQPQDDEGELDQEREVDPESARFDRQKDDAGWNLKRQPCGCERDRITSDLPGVAAVFGNHLQVEYGNAADDEGGS